MRKCCVVRPGTADISLLGLKSLNEGPSLLNLELQHADRSLVKDEQSGNKTKRPPMTKSAWNLPIRRRESLLRRANISVVGVRKLHLRQFGLQLNANVLAFGAAITGKRQQILVV